MPNKPGKNTFSILLVGVLILVVVVVVVSKIPPEGAQRIGAIPILSRYQQTPESSFLPATVASTSTSSPTATHARSTATPTATHARSTATPTATHAHPTATPTATHAHPTATPTAAPTDTPVIPTATAVIAVTTKMTPTQSEEPTPMAPLPGERIAAILGEPEHDSWQMIPDLDLNQDGKKDEIIAYQPATLSLAPSFSDPVYQGYDLLVTTFAILQERQPDDLRILLHNTPEKIDAGGGEETVTFAEAPAAFLVKVASKSQVPLTVIPVNTKGERMMPAIGLNWSAQHMAYQLLLSLNRTDSNQE